MSTLKENERDWWLFCLFMLLTVDPEHPDALDNHVCRLAGAYANPRDFIAVLKQGGSHPAFTGVQTAKGDPIFIEQWENFIGQAPHSYLASAYEQAVATEERERIERLQAAQRTIENEGRVQDAAE